MLGRHAHRELSRWSRLLTVTSKNLGEDDDASTNATDHEVRDGLASDGQPITGQDPRRFTGRPE